MIISLEYVEKFFSEAMALGYASGAEPTEILELVGFKGYRHIKGQLALLDYFTVQDSLSFGTTVIWSDRTPIWAMQYQGWYDETVIPLLKKALMNTYSAGFFRGGRGIDYKEPGGGPEYRNINPSSDFCNFRGEETIVQMQDGKLVTLGAYYFRGMSLIRLL